uniref:Uncharacterized protein n=1 Tax=Oryza nivara TaxID=4536 RepID=A0A0E0IJN1_ORYNI
RVHEAAGDPRPDGHGEGGDDGVHLRLHRRPPVHQPHRLRLQVRRHHCFPLPLSLSLGCCCFSCKRVSDADSRGGIIRCRVVLAVRSNSRGPLDPGRTVRIGRRRGSLPFLLLSSGTLSRAAAAAVSARPPLPHPPPGARDPRWGTLHLGRLKLQIRRKKQNKLLQLTQNQKRRSAVLAQTPRS